LFSVRIEFNSTTGSIVITGSISRFIDIIHC
jgi:hypothetical protein